MYTPFLKACTDMSPLSLWLERKASWIGIITVPIAIFATYLALVWSPPDVNMGQTVRLMYVHVPSIITAYLALTVCLLASLGYLWKKDLAWDDVAYASGEIGVVLTALAITAGAIWGHVTWGVYWTWDPRLTTTAVLFVIFAGYLLLRALTDDAVLRARTSAVVAIIGFLDIPVVHFSVVWWRSLHQSPPNPISPPVHGRMLLTLCISFVAFFGVYLFLLGKRIRLARLQRTVHQIDWSAEPAPAQEFLGGLSGAD
jgi:heme exporter protein C